MSISLQDYAKENLYTRGLGYAANQVERGFMTEIWLKQAPYGSERADSVLVTADLTNVMENDVTIDLSVGAADSGFKLYAKDILRIVGATEQLTVVLAEDVTLTDTPTTTAIMPVIGAPQTDTTGIAESYGLVPIQSVQDGGLFSATISTTEANNKQGGNWTLLAATRASGSVNFSGTVYKADPGIKELQIASEELLCYLHVELRYTPFIDFSAMDPLFVYGGGPGAKRGIFTLGGLEYTANQDGFITFSSSLNAGGLPEDYSILVYNPTP